MATRMQKVRQLTVSKNIEPVVAVEQAWHVLTVDAVKNNLQTDTTRGLSQVEAARRLTQHGPNSLVQARGRSTFAILLGV